MKLYYLKTLKLKRLTVLFALLSTFVLVTNSASADELITFPCGYVQRSEEFTRKLDELRDKLFLTSPNGKWHIRNEEAYGDQWLHDIYSLHIINSEHAITYTVTFSKTYGIKYDAMDGTVDALHWTKDSKSVYLTVTPQGDGPNVYLRDGNLLLKLDTATGKVQTIVETVISGFVDNYAFSISPDDKLLFSIKHTQPPQLSITDLGTGKRRKMGLKITSAYAAGNIVWSPDGSQIAFMSLEQFDDVVGWSLNIYTGQANRLWRGSRKLLSTRLIGWSDSRHVIVANAPEDSDQAITCEQIDVRTQQSTSTTQ